MLRFKSISSSFLTVYYVTSTAFFSILQRLSALVILSGLLLFFWSFDDLCYTSLSFTILLNVFLYNLLLGKNSFFLLLLLISLCYHICNGIFRFIVCFDWYELLAMDYQPLRLKFFSLLTRIGIRSAIYSSLVLISLFWLM